MQTGKKHNACIPGVIITYDLRLENIQECHIKNYLISLYKTEINMLSETVGILSVNTINVLRRGF